MQLILAILTPVSSTIGDATDGNVSVSLTATGLSDGKLALNNAAIFIADVVGYEGDPSDLGFRWTLAMERGELSDRRNSMPNNAVGGNSIACIGKTAGDEQIRVELLDGANRTLATASYAFTIVPPTDPVIRRECFDQPKIIYQYGTSFYMCNYDGTGQQYFGVGGGVSTAISPYGEWIAWNDDSDEPPYLGWDMCVQGCDGSEKTKIPVGTSEDSLPLFSPDSKTLYFLRPEQY